MKNRKLFLTLKWLSLTLAIGFFTLRVYYGLNSDNLVERKYDYLNRGPIDYSTGGLYTAILGTVFFLIFIFLYLLTKDSKKD